MSISHQSEKLHTNCFFDRVQPKNTEPHLQGEIHGHGAIRLSGDNYVIDDQQPVKEKNLPDYKHIVYTENEGEKRMRTNDVEPSHKEALRPMARVLTSRIANSQ